MERQRKTVSVADELSRIEEQISDVLDEAEDLDSDSEAYEEKEVEYQAYSIKKQNLEELVEELSDDEFRIKELSFGELMQVRDDVMSVSSRDNPREGLYQVKVLEIAVEDSPSELSDEPKDWNPQIAELIYDKVDELNTGVSQESLGNYSLEEAMADR